jgi:hypothetical protein
MPCCRAWTIIARARSVLRWKPRCAWGTPAAWQRAGSLVHASGKNNRSSIKVTSAPRLRAANTPT